MGQTAETLVWYVRLGISKVEMPMTQPRRTAAGKAPLVQWPPGVVGHVEYIAEYLNCRSRSSVDGSRIAGSLLPRSLEGQCTRCVC
jgi:hypothetical protein